MNIEKWATINYIENCFSDADLDSEFTEGPEDEEGYGEEDADDESALADIETDFEDRDNMPSRSGQKTQFFSEYFLMVKKFSSL